VIGLVKGYSGSPKLAMKVRCLKYKGWRCSVCDRSDFLPGVLTFHHVNPDQKEMGINAMITKRRTFTRIRMELDKTVVMCLNCHGSLHWKENHLGYGG